MRFSTVAPFCCRTTPTFTAQHGPVRFYSDSSTAHVRFYRPTESTPPRALARQCRFTMLYTVAPRSADVQDSSGTAAKEGGGRFRGEGDISAIWAGKFYFYTSLESTGDYRNSVKKNIFGRHTKIKSSDLTCALYAARVNFYKKKGGNILCKISARWMCPGTAPGAL